MTTSQNVIKYLAIALAIFIIASMATGVVWLVQNVFNITDSTPLTKETYDLDNYKDLDISVGASTLKIKTCDKATLEITSDYTYELKDNELSIYTKTNKLRHKNKSEITLCVTNPSFDNVRISGGAGSINITSLEANKVKFDLGAGDVVIDSLTVLESIKLSGGAGNVKISNSFLTDSDIDLGVGNFTLNTTFKGDTDIDMGVGNLDVKLLDGIENYSFDIDKGLGNVKIDGMKKSSGKYGVGNTLIRVDGGVGNIDIK